MVCRPFISTNEFSLIIFEMYITKILVAVKFVSPDYDIKVLFFPSEKSSKHNACQKLRRAWDYFKYINIKISELENIGWNLHKI